MVNYTAKEMLISGESNTLFVVFFEPLAEMGVILSFFNRKISIVNKLFAKNIPRQSIFKQFSI